MKIACCGDQHITKHKPKNRTDTYFKTCLEKFAEELTIADEEGCSVIVFPGDIFDQCKEDHYVAQAVINILKEYHPRMECLCVAGQHDQKFHNPDLTGTVLGTILASEYLTLLTSNPKSIGGVDFYGASWKDEIPVVSNPNAFNVLVTHKMIIEEKLWAEQEGHTWANHLLMKNKFDLIVSGDNHNQFFTSVGKRHLLNLGSMMRSTIAQVNHKPAIAICDTDHKDYIVVDLEVKPIADIMCVEKAEQAKERKAELDSFIKTLKDDSTESAKKLNFVDSLMLEVEKNNVDETVVAILKESLEVLNG